MSTNINTLNAGIQEAQNLEKSVLGVKLDQSNINLSVLGLNETHLTRVNEVKESLSDLTNLKISEYGKGLQGKTNESTDTSLELIKCKDMDVIGEQLNNIVTVSREINSSNISKPGFFGSLFHSTKKAKDKFKNKFASVSDQMEVMVNEVEVNQKSLTDRVKLLDTMFDNITDEVTNLGIHVAAGQYRLLEIQEEMKVIPKNDNPENIQKIQDLNNLYNKLDKRVHDLHLLQQSAVQTMPMIRIIQMNNLMLVDKFFAIKNIVLPTWKNQIILAISLVDQEKSVKMAKAIDDTTRDLLRRNAEMLHMNSVATAKANSASVIDVETLEYVQNQLIATVNDVIKIQEEGSRDRANAERKLTTLRETYTKTIKNNNLLLSNKSK